MNLSLKAICLFGFIKCLGDKRFFCCLFRHCERLSSIGMLCCYALVVFQAPGRLFFQREALNLIILACKHLCRTPGASRHLFRLNTCGLVFDLAWYQRSFCRGAHKLKHIHLQRNAQKLHSFSNTGLIIILSCSKVQNHYDYLQYLPFQNPFEYLHLLFRPISPFERSKSIC